MTGRTLALYDACELATTMCAPFPPERVRDALGYVGWSPSGEADSSPERAPPTAGGSSSLRRAAHGLRRSFAGRAFARLTPARIRNALKRRFS